MQFIMSLEIFLIPRDIFFNGGEPERDWFGERCETDSLLVIHP